ncbi:unnamed protein product, partial [Musa hybrid cultivar]
PSAPTLKPQANTSADISIFVSPICYQSVPLLPYAAAFLLMSAAWIQPSYLSTDITAQSWTKEEEEEEKGVEVRRYLETAAAWKGRTVITAAKRRRGNIAAAKKRQHCSGEEAKRQHCSGEGATLQRRRDNASVSLCRAAASSA